MQSRAFILSALVVAPALAAAAPPFEVAGIKVTPAGEGWDISDAEGPPVKIGSGGIDGVKPGEGRLLIKRAADGRVLAAILVSGTRGRTGITLRGSCPDKTQPGMHDYQHGNPQGGARACASVGGPFRVKGNLQHLEYLAKAQAAKGFEVPEGAYFFWGYAIDQNAAAFNIEGIAALDFAGLPGVQPAKTPGQGVKPEIAAWGEALGAAIRQAHDGVFSRSTTLPPFDFLQGSAAR